MVSMPQTHRPRKTREDYLALPDEVRAELIDGELYVTPSPGFSHQDVVGRLYRVLSEYVERLELGRVGLSPLDVHLPGGDIVQPDLLFVAQSRRAIVQDWVHGAPDLVIEVLSPSRPDRDRFVKRVVYERAGVSEYWVVDPEERSIEVLSLDGGRYRSAGYVTSDQVLTSRILAGLQLPLSRVFA